VRLETNEGIVGWGEATPLGPNYLPAFAEGIRAGLPVLAHSILGKNPLSLNEINVEMDRALKGHPYIKSAIDVACWDIRGKVAGLPVCELMGGRCGPSFPLYRAISQGTAAEMAANVEKYVDQGYRKFQLKVGGRPRDDIDRIRAVRSLLDTKTKELRALGETDLYIPLLCDANTGWQRHEAVQVVNGVKDLDVYIEQPCLTYEECLSVRRMCPLPMVLDECVDDIGTLVRLLNDRAADVINLKISKVGGLTKARAIRDLAVSSGIPMNIEDTWGGDIVTATIAHLAHSTDPKFLFCSTDFNSYGPVTIAKTTAHRINGRLSAPVEPGLGKGDMPSLSIITRYQSSSITQHQSISFIITHHHYFFDLFPLHPSFLPPPIVCCVSPCPLPLDPWTLPPAPNAHTLPPPPIPTHHHPYPPGVEPIMEILGPPVLDMSL
jgi:L-alanine-DL-glutamate epimerase-like enolase superfamily enzyme